jgi:hypothetical protein
MALCECVLCCVTDIMEREKEKPFEISGSLHHEGWPWNGSVGQPEGTGSPEKGGWKLACHWK